MMADVGERLLAAVVVAFGAALAEDDIPRADRLVDLAFYLLENLNGVGQAR